jgi:hypothetical protein
LHDELVEIVVLLLGTHTLHGLNTRKKRLEQLLLLLGVKMLQLCEGCQLLTLLILAHTQRLLHSLRLHLVHLLLLEQLLPLLLVSLLLLLGTETVKKLESNVTAGV